MFTAGTEGSFMPNIEQYYSFVHYNINQDRILFSQDYFSEDVIYKLSEWQ